MTRGKRSRTPRSPCAKSATSSGRRRLTGRTTRKERSRFVETAGFPAGRSREGQRPVSVALEVKDTASHRSKVARILVSKTRSSSWRPESGAAAPASKTVFILTSYRRDRPRRPSAVNHPGAAPKDASGIAPSRSTRQQRSAQLKARTRGASVDGRTELDSRGNRRASCSDRRAPSIGSRTFSHTSRRARAERVHRRVKKAGPSHTRLKRRRAAGSRRRPDPACWDDRSAGPNSSNGRRSDLDRARLLGRPRPQSRGVGAASYRPGDERRIDLRATDKRGAPSRRRSASRVDEGGLSPSGQAAGIRAGFHVHQKDAERATK